MNENERVKTEIYMRFPGWKTKAMTLSYDDGVVQDKRLIEIMTRYGLKGTFNLNSALFGFSQSRLSIDEAKKLYIPNGMEIALHGEKHLFAGNAPAAVAMREFLSDKSNLEREFDVLVRGMAYAHGSFNDDVVEILKLLGIVYGRLAGVVDKSFSIPGKNALKFIPTCHHNDPDLMNLLEDFIAKDPNETYRRTPLLFYLWGHSYEFDDNDNWCVIESFAKRVSEREDIYHATNIEIFDYIRAFNELIYSADCSKVYNPTATDVYIRVGYYGDNVLVKSGQTIKI